MVIDAFWHGTLKEKKWTINLDENCIISLIVSINCGYLAANLYWLFLFNSFASGFIYPLFIQKCAMLRVFKEAGTCHFILFIRSIFVFWKSSFTAYLFPIFLENYHVESRLTVLANWVICGSDECLLIRSTRIFWYFDFR